MTNATISDLSSSDIIDRCGDINEDEAERMRIVVENSEWIDTPTAEIPEREWLRMLTEACDSDDDD